MQCSQSQLLVCCVTPRHARLDATQNETWSWSYNFEYCIKYRTSEHVSSKYTEIEILKGTQVHIQQTLYPT